MQNQRTFEEKFARLKTELSIMGGALSRVRQSANSDEMVTVVRSLRVLIYRPKQNPVLLGLAADRKYDLVFWFVDLGLRPDLTDEFFENYGEGVGKSSISGPLPIWYENPGDIPYVRRATISEYLDDVAFRVKGTLFTGEQLLGRVAGKVGAHFDSNVPDWIKALESIAPWGEQYLNYYFSSLAKLAEVVLHLGNEFVETIELETASQ